MGHRNSAGVGRRRTGTRPGARSTSAGGDWLAVVAANPTQLGHGAPLAVDLDRYPIHDLDGPRARAVIAEQTERFTQHGVAIMPDFVPPAAVTRMAAEAERLAPDLYHQDVMGTPYLAAPDHSFPDGHPRRHLVARP